MHYHTQLYTSQLALLLQHVGWSKAIIVGLSMGGAITAAFADTFPHLVDGRVAFLASVGNFPVRAASLAYPVVIFTAVTDTDTLLMSTTSMLLIINDIRTISFLPNTAYGSPRSPDCALHPRLYERMRL